MKRLILLFLMPMLAACATPRESCLAAATRDLATVDGLIAETQANLQRGFALDREYYTGTRVDVCFGGWRTNVGWSYCSVPYTRVRTEPVAIDRAAENQKLRDLQSTRVRLAREAESRIAQCDARYPLN